MSNAELILKLVEMLLESEKKRVSRVANNQNNKSDDD